MTGGEVTNILTSVAVGVSIVGYCSKRFDLMRDEIKAGDRETAEAVREVAREANAAIHELARDTAAITSRMSAVEATCAATHGLHEPIPLRPRQVGA